MHKKVIFSLSLVALLSACQSMTAKPPLTAVAEMKPTTAAAGAQLTPTGRVKFTQLTNGKVLIEANISGLKPNAEHGFHVHAVADCSGDGLKTGAHFNPDNHPHNHPAQANRHAGALFNLKTNAQGVGVLRQEADTITLTDGKYSVIGQPLITHRDPDDYVSQPLGNAGPRISCGIIAKS